MDDQSEAVGLLREIRDHVGRSVATLEAHGSSVISQQRLQLERQAEAMAIQREQFDMAKRQFERAERLQERAEQLQARSASVIAVARKTMWIVLPVIVVLVLYLSWLVLAR